jgi:hypothetical protein
MPREKFTLTFLLMLQALTAGVGLLPRTSVAIAASPDAHDVHGTWSGTFRARHSHPAPFTLNLAIGTDNHGRIINQSGIISCLARGDIDLHVIVNGSDVVLAGADAVGNTLTFHGTIDSTGKVLNFNYTTNGSASGKCESDNGTAVLQKQ